MMKKQKNKSKSPSSFSNKNIIIGSLNIQGGFVTKTKLNDFHRLLNSCHIFGVQETWLENQESFKVSDLNIFEVKGLKVRKHVEILVECYCSIREVLLRV